MQRPANPTANTFPIRPILSLIVSGPISPTYPAGDWRTWEVADQRFRRKPSRTFLTYLSAPLDHDLVITGPLSARLFASTSGTDSDFVVKLIDVYPQDAQKPDWNPDQGPKPVSTRNL